MTEIITCECGLIVRGSSEKHAESNLKQHKTSKRHKELMKIIKAQQDVLKHKNKGSELSDEVSKND